MELIPAIAFILLGLAAGYAIAHFRSRSQLSRLEERNENLDGRNRELETKLEEAQRSAGEAEKQLAELNADYRNLKERLEEQKQEMKELQERFKDEFENLANKILEEKSKKFTEQNKEKLDQLLKPLGEKLEAFKKKVEETHKDEVEARGSLKEQLKNLMELNQQMSKEAKNLTSALKGDTQKMGAWGEIFLERILEQSGLQKGREYELQVSGRDSDDRLQRPDAVVYLPDEKYLVIDSKVSLKAYERFTSAEEDEEQKQALNEHLISIRSHVRNLSDKNYQQLFDEKSPDFVLMFIPIESAFGAAFQTDPTLYNEAFDRNIVIVSPSTLLATLATVHNVWKREYQNQNALKIANRGGELYDKFALFVESLQDIGMRLRQTQESYDTAMNRLSTGRGNLLRQVEMLKELGAQASKQLPGDLAEPAETEEDTLPENDLETEQTEK